MFLIQNTVNHNGVIVSGEGNDIRMTEHDFANGFQPLKRRLVGGYAFRRNAHAKISGSVQ